MFVDLHLHTTYSDGSFTPKEVIKKAKEIGYSIVRFLNNVYLETQNKNSIINSNIIE